MTQTFIEPHPAPAPVIHRTPYPSFALVIRVVLGLTLVWELLSADIVGAPTIVLFVAS